jgi:hypothetical protein
LEQSRLKLRVDANLGVKRPSQSVLLHTDSCQLPLGPSVEQKANWIKSRVFGVRRDGINHVFGKQPAGNRWIQRFESVDLNVIDFALDMRCHPVLTSRMTLNNRQEMTLTRSVRSPNELGI